MKTRPVTTAIEAADAVDLACQFFFLFILETTAYAYVRVALGPGGMGCFHDGSRYLGVHSEAGVFTLPELLSFPCVWVFVDEGFCIAICPWGGS